MNQENLLYSKYVLNIINEEEFDIEVCKEILIMDTQNYVSKTFIILKLYSTGKMTLTEVFESFHTENINTIILLSIYSHFKFYKYLFNLKELNRIMKEFYMFKRTSFKEYSRISNFSLNLNLLSVYYSIYEDKLLEVIYTNINYQGITNCADLLISLITLFKIYGVDFKDKEKQINKYYYNKHNSYFKTISSDNFLFVQNNQLEVNRKYLGSLPSEEKKIFDSIVKEFSTEQNLTNFYILLGINN